MAVSSGNPGCPCINATSLLSSLSDRSCVLDNGDNGVQLTVGGACVPLAFGSSECIAHDMKYNSACDISVPPPYCIRPWCYVDYESCIKDSDERIYRSSYFDVDSGVDVYFSYSTCNSTADDFFSAQETVLTQKALWGADLVANSVIPYVAPIFYKQDNNGNVFASGRPEYYNNSIPWHGIYYEYVKELIKLSEGDINTVNIYPASRVSKLVHPSSPGTASIQDVQDGLFDMSIGPYWVTPERLKMTTFTLPIISDKTFLVIPKPGSTSNLQDEARKVIEPFSTGLWLFILGIILLTALLSVWFSHDSERTKNGTTEGTDRGTERKRLARIAIDSCMQKGVWFCNASVEQDQAGSFPEKLLRLGFGFFILIAVSAYVANLAAFLTRKPSNNLTTMQGVVDAGYGICAHPALRTELESSWPGANFTYHEEGNEFRGVLEDYLSGKCRAMAVGYEDTSMDVEFLEKLRLNNLVYTTSVIVEVPIAFPIRAGISSGFSHWILQGSRHGIDLESTKNKFQKSISSFDFDDVHLNEGDSMGSEDDTITINNMFLPITFFGACTLVAVLLQLKHQRNEARQIPSALGRTSRLLVSNGTRRKQGSVNEVKSDGQKPIWIKAYLHSSLEDGELEETLALSLTRETSESPVEDNPEEQSKKVDFDLEHPEELGQADSRGYF